MKPPGMGLLILEGHPQKRIILQGNYCFQFLYFDLDSLVDGTGFVSSYLFVFLETFHDY